MGFTTILIIIFTVIVAILLIVGLIITFLVLKTIKDIQQIIKSVSDISENVKDKKFSEALENPLIREKVIILISSRFGLFAPIANLVISKVIYKKKQKVI